MPDWRCVAATIIPCSPPPAASSLVFLAGLLLVPLAGTTAADATRSPSTDAVLTQAGLDLVTLTNRQRAKLGLVALRIDPDLMAIARDRAEVMAANDVMSHTEPNGQKVFDRLTAAGITWYNAGEILAWNNYPTEPLSVAESIYAWMASPDPPRHHGLDRLRLRRLRRRGLRDRPALLRRRLRQGTRRDGRRGALREGQQRIASAGTRVRVTLRWSGGDPRLQVMTAGLRYYQLAWRNGDGPWHAWFTTTATSRSVRWSRGSGHTIRHPGARQGRQLGRLAQHPYHGLIRPRVLPLLVRQGRPAICRPRI